MAKRVRHLAAQGPKRPSLTSRSSGTSGRSPSRRASPKLHSSALEKGLPVALPPPPTPAPAPEAVGVFQTGMEALQRHQYRPAADSFHALIARFPGERALLDRARVYADLCERELGRRPVQAVTAEERLTLATAALNDGDEARAETFVTAVLSEHPEQDLALYLSAAIHARRGHHEEALAQLRQAIAVSPDVAAQATLDADFDALHDSEAFQALTESSGPMSRRPALTHRRLRH